MGAHVTSETFALYVVFVFLMSSVMTALGFMFAWKIDSVQGYHGIMNMVMMPMWILSGSMFPISTSHWFLRWLGYLNPMTYAVSSLRYIIGDQVSANAGSLIGSFLFLIVCLVVLGGISKILVTRSERLA